MICVKKFKTLLLIYIMRHNTGILRGMLTLCTLSLVELFYQPLSPRAPRLF